MLGGDGRADADGRKADARGIAGPSGTGTDAGISPPTAALLSMRVATAAQGCPDAAAVVGVRNGGSSGAALFALPVRGDRRHTLNPVAENIPDRCTPEYERIIAKMGSLLPYARARTLMSEFLPLGDVPAVETTRGRTMRVAARHLFGTSKQIIDYDFHAEYALSVMSAPIMPMSGVRLPPPTVRAGGGLRRDNGDSRG
jgi:hypothetical protein